MTGDKIVVNEVMVVTHSFPRCVGILSTIPGLFDFVRPQNSCNGENGVSTFSRFFFT